MEIGSMIEGKINIYFCFLRGYLSSGSWEQTYDV